MKYQRALAFCLAVFLACFVSTTAARAAVAQLGSPAQINNNTTLSYTVPAGTNRVLVVNASGSDLNNLTNITGVTFNGTPMFLAVKRDDTSVAVDSLWYLPMGTNTSSGTPGTVVATVTGGTVTALGAVTFQGVDQNGPMNGAQSAIFTGSNASSSLNIVSRPGDMVMDLFDIYDPSQVGTENPGAGQTVIHDIDAPAGNLYGYYKTSRKDGAATVNMSWTSTSTAMIHVAANIKQAPVPFTTGNLVVLRVGDGTGNPANTTTTASAGFLDEYTPAGALVQSVALPPAGTNQATVGGATTDGALTRTPDGSRLYFGAYRTAPGTTSGGSTSNTVPRVLGYVDAAAGVNTATAANDASLGQVRSAVSLGGTGNIYFTTGNGGVRVMTGHGSVTTTTQIEALNAREVVISGTSLLSSNTVSGGGAGVRSYGASLPTAATGSTLLTTSNPSATGFVALDLSAGVAGDDTIYLATGPGTGTQNTLEKYCLVGGNWTAAGSVNLPVNTTQWYVAGSASGSTATLYVVLPGFAGSASTVYKLTDSSGYNATLTGSFSTIASAPANADFRGIAMAPAAASNNADLSALSFSAGSIAPAFGAATTSYSFNVGNATTSTTVTATKADTNANLQVQVNGGGFTALTSGSPSSALALNVGANTVDVKVTAQNGTTIKTYTTTITRATPPDLTMVITNTPATFTVGSNGTINVVVTNSGGDATSGNITVNIPLPTGFTLQSVASGSDWNATASTATTAIATRGTSLAAGASASTITLTVAVGPTAAQSSVVSGTVSGGGETNTANDGATDTIPVITPPVVTTPTSASVTHFTATLGGNVTSDGGAAVSERGVVLSATATNNNPQIGGTGVTKITATGTTGVFTVGPTGLTPNTAYSYKAYATNSTGTGYTTAGTFTTTALPNLTLNDVTLAEGNAGTTSFTFTVSLSSPAPAGGVTFDIATADGTATAANSDYTAKSLTAQSIAAGNTSYTFTVLVNGDTAIESNETFFVNVTNVVRATMTDGQGQGTITNDDSAVAPTVTTPTSASVTHFGATLGGSVTSDGGAAISERGVVLARTSQNGDPLIGGANVTKLTTTGTTGVFTLSATSLTPNTAYSYKAYATNSTGTGYTAVGTFNTTALPNLSINDVTLAEGDTGTTNFNFTVNLSAPAPAGGVTFDIATANGTATAGGNDYVAKSLTAQTIAAGNTTYSFTVVVNGDTAVEANETFFVNVTNVTNAIVTDGQGQGTITNDDVAPTVTTPTVTGVTATGATLGGNVTSSGSAAVSERGVVFALTAQNANPQIGGANVTKVSTTGTTGVFTVPVSSLAANSGYSYAAYATTAAGTGYTSVDTFTTAVGNAAPTDIMLSNATLAENNTAGATIGTLGAVDPDSGQTHTFAFASGTGGADNGAFTITGNTLTINGVADFETQASYSIRVRATDNGTPALSFDKVLTITVTDVANPQTITFGPLGEKTFGDADFLLVATGGASGQPVTFTSSGPVTITGNSVHITGAGDVTITAHQAGSATGDYGAAQDVPQSFTVLKASQTITFTLPASAADTDSLTLSATGGASGNPVTFTVFSGPGEITGNVLTFTGTGDVVVHADQAGNANYLAAPTVSATVQVTTEAGLTLADDAVTTTGIPATVYPLANDTTTNLGQLTITSVSDPSVTIVGRALLVPAGTADFTYTATDGTATNTAAVHVINNPSTGTHTQFNGLLYDGQGAIGGWAKVTISARGFATAQVRTTAGTGNGKFSFPVGSTSGSGATKLGTASITLNADGTADLTLAGPVLLTGHLRPSRGNGPAERIHVALASVQSDIPGGGFVVVTLKASGLTNLIGQLPDGRPFSASTEASDNGTLAIFALENKGVNPAGRLGGELTPADLDTTDVTGELGWTKPPQTPGAKGQHLSGVDTTLVANGSLYHGVVPGSGSATLTLSGGNLAADETTAVTVNGGIPAVPAGSLVGWAGVRPNIGKFSVRIRVPGSARPIIGGGLYLPKSQSAWGYFPGLTEGGRIQLEIDGQ